MVKPVRTTAYVTTVQERCRVCYTCVRECPAKAIRVSRGQAEVMAERCIGCGNCVRVCSQGAKDVLSSIEPVEAMLRSRQSVVACLAPSFPAEFDGVNPRRLVGMLRRLGFSLVCEVAFGADLVARAYRELLARDDGRRWIATTCPAVIGYVERYHPGLVKSLAPIVSPMVATARALRHLHGRDLRVVFIGPCIAKKIETASRCLLGDIDAALTFTELRQMFALNRIEPQAVIASDFDPPWGAEGALFPVSRGILQAASLDENLMDGDIIAVHGRVDFVEAIKEFDSGTLKPRLLEVLACQGCIMGPGMTSRRSLYERRASISQYVRGRMQEHDPNLWRDDVNHLGHVELGRGFTSDDQRLPPPSASELARIMADLGKFTPADELNCGACGYDTCHEHAIAIYKGLAEYKMCLPYAIDQLRSICDALARSNDELADTREALVQAEKLASMGQLAAGIAHEVNNPLGVVLLYAHLLNERFKSDRELNEDLGMIVEQADRCKKIVSGLLNFARQNEVALAPTNLNELVQRAVKALPMPDGIKIRIEPEPGDAVADVDRDQIVQILTNLVSNARAAMGETGTITICVKGDKQAVRLSVHDTGVGIPRENLSKIFEPFFTTKEAGKGTGLGLAVIYGIVKMHRGDIQVESNTNPADGPTGATFTVTLPRHARREEPAPANGHSANGGTA